MFDWQYNPDFIGPTYPKAVIITGSIGVNDDPIGVLLPIVQIDPAGFDNGSHGKQEQTTYFHVPHHYCMEDHVDAEGYDCRRCRGFFFNTDGRFVTSDDERFVSDCIYVWHPGDVMHARLLGHEVEDLCGLLVEGEP